jgi:mRNA interferase MazF
VISGDFLGEIPLRIIVPVTSWQQKFVDRHFMVHIPRTVDNGLDRDSSGNVLQVRSVSLERFVAFRGRVSAHVMQEILAGLIICIDYQ